MIKKAILLCLLLSLTLIITQSGGLTAQQQPHKPVKQRTIHSAGGIGAPPTLSELFDLSPLVVRATVVGSRALDRILPSDDPRNRTIVVETAHTLSVHEIFRDAVQGGIKGRRVEVVQLGGDRDRGAYIESVIDDAFPPLRHGLPYVLFLKPSPRNDGTFVVATETSDSVLILADDATVKTRGRSRLATDLERFTHGDLLNALRDLRDVRK